MAVVAAAWAALESLPARADPVPAYGALRDALGALVELDARTIRRATRAEAIAGDLAAEATAGVARLAAELGPR